MTAKAPALKALLKSPEWRNLISYVGACASAPIVYVESLYRQGGAIDPQTRLHCDTFHSTTKAWIYLNDLRENAAAFNYVPGTHRLTPQILARQAAMSPGSSASVHQITCHVRFPI